MSGNNSSINKVTAASLLVALGIIYGDIGTSPLYVLKAIVGDRKIDEALVFGGVSCIFWTLVFKQLLNIYGLRLKQITKGKVAFFHCMHWYVDMEKN